ncbi:MAG: cytochrome P450 [Beijerinckiaceae bacterium]|nr:cytochrome P450 [Beijerinckiaceae bacterium]
MDQAGLPTQADGSGETPHFVPYELVLHDKPYNRLWQLWYLARNPIDIWVKHHFEQLVVLGPSLVGKMAVVSDPAGIRHVLVDNAANYAKDPLQLRVLSSGAPPGAAPGLLIASGEQWRTARRTLAPLFTPKRVSTLAATMHKTAAAHVEKWLTNGNRALEIDREMTGLTYDILSATLFSNALAGSGKAFENQLSILLNSIGQIHPFDVFNAPGWLPRFGKGAGVKARLFFEGAMRQLLQTRIAESETGKPLPDDLLSALILARDPETGNGLGHEEIVANLFTFIAAGHETTARALTWTLYLLSHAPSWESRCIDEALHAPDDPALWLEAMPAIRAAFEEAMRLFPPAPMLSRIAGSDDFICGHAITVAPWLVHRHRRLWENPDAFVPERFMPGHREQIDRFAYLPFGGGPRVCIGQVFALQEAVIVLASILQKLRLRHDGPAPQPLHRITLRPHRPIDMTWEPHTALT